MQSILQPGKLFLLLLLVFPTFFLDSCREKESPVSPRPYSRLKTLAVEETEAGATFRGEIFYYGPSRILDHGFEWSTSLEPYSAPTYRHSLGPGEDAGPFSALIAGSLEPGKMYYLRAFVKDDKYVVYGNVIRFQSKGSPAPVIETVLPARVTFGDTITIQGRHFNRLFSENRVWFNEQAARVLSTSETTLRAIVPATITAPVVKLNLKTGERYLTRENAFQLAPPVITRFTPESGTNGTVVTIDGANFHPEAGKNYVGFGANGWGNVIEANPKRLVVSVAYGGSAGPVELEVKVAGQTTVAATPFQLTGQ